MQTLTHRFQSQDYPNGWDMVYGGRALQKVRKALNFASTASEETTNYLHLIFKTPAIIRKPALNRTVAHDERHK